MTWLLVTAGSSTENFINLSRRQRNLKRCLSEISAFTNHTNFTKQYQSLEKWTIPTVSMFSYIGRTFKYVLRFRRNCWWVSLPLKEIWPLYLKCSSPSPPSWWWPVKHIFLSNVPLHPPKLARQLSCLFWVYCDGDAFFILFFILC